jgi:hypothetical protein
MAPAILSAAKASEDAAIKADRPSETASPSIVRPAAFASADHAVAQNPKRMEFDIASKMAGPGLIAGRILTRTKNAQVPAVMDAPDMSSPAYYTKFYGV